MDYTTLVYRLMSDKELSKCLETRVKIAFLIPVWN